MARTSASVIPGSVAAWPASGMIFSVASGQARCRSHALIAGQTMSYRPCTITAGNVSNPINVFEQVVVSFEEAIVHEVVTLDSREGDCQLRFVKFVD